MHYIFLEAQEDMTPSTLFWKRIISNLDIHRAIIAFCSKQKESVELLIVYLLLLKL